MPSRTAKRLISTLRTTRRIRTDWPALEVSWRAEVRVERLVWQRALLGLRCDRRGGVSIVRSRHLQNAREDAGVPLHRMAYRQWLTRTGDRGRAVVWRVSTTPGSDCAR